MAYQRNTDPKFWEENHIDCNCGSFAFNLTDWFTPYDDSDERDNFIMKLLDDCQDQNIDYESYMSKIATLVACRDVRYILDELGDFVTAIRAEDVNTLNNSIIVAYRVGVNLPEEQYFYDDFDTDFHFKVRINDQWYEKNGTEEVHKCELNPDQNWILIEHEYNNDTNEVCETYFHYNSKIFYFKVVR